VYRTAARSWFSLGRSASHDPRGRRSASNSSSQFSRKLFDSQDFLRRRSREAPAARRRPSLPVSKKHRVANADGVLIQGSRFLKEAPMIPDRFWLTDTSLRRSYGICRQIHGTQIHGTRPESMTGG
jgi:hypothetical protein